MSKSDEKIMSRRKLLGGVAAIAAASIAGKCGLDHDSELVGDSVAFDGSSSLQRASGSARSFTVCATVVTCGVDSVFTRQRLVDAHKQMVPENSEVVVTAHPLSDGVNLMARTYLPA